MSKPTSFQSQFTPAETGEFTALFPASIAQAAFPPPWRNASPTSPQISPAAEASSALPMPDVLLDARRQADALLAEARQQAATLIEAEQSRATEETRQAQLSVFEQASKELLRALQRDWYTALSRLEEEVTLLAVDIAEKVLRRRLESDPETILPLVQEAIQRLAGSAKVQVVVHPQQEQAVREAQEELASLLGADSRLEVLVREEVEPGGCLIYGDRGSVDARLSTQLQTIRTALRDVLAGDQAAT